MTIPKTIADQLTSPRISMLLYVDQREPVLLMNIEATFTQVEALEWLDDQGLIALTKGGTCAVTTRVGHEIVQDLLKPSTEK